MWIMDLQIALNELFEMYGCIVTIEKIVNGNIYLSNHTVWHFNAEGLERREEE